jgi:hypothetical protein
MFSRNVIATMGWIGPIALALLILYPMLRLGFIADDLLMSLSAGRLGFEHISVWQETWGQISWWVRTEGRFFPIPFVYSYLFFSLNPSMLAEKIIQLAAVLVNIATLFFLVRHLAGARFAGIVTLFSVACLQVRSWFDPILAFFVLLPLTSEALLLCFGSWLLAVERRSARYAVAGLAFALFALLSYEMTYPIILVIGICCYFRANHRSWKIASIAGNVLPVGILCFVDAILRAHAPVTTYAIKWDAGAYARTFAEQLVAAIPLSFSIFSNHGVPNFFGESASTYVAAIIGALLAYVLLRSPIAATSRGGVVSLLAFGLAMWVFPAAIISFSHPLQIRIDHGFGNGYLNVYLEYVGVAVLAAALVVVSFQAMASKPLLREASAAALAVSFGILIGLVGSEDRASMTVFVPLWTNERTNLDRALSAGLITPLTRGASATYWDSPYPMPAAALPNLIYANSHEAVPGTFLEQAKLDPSRLCAARTNYCQVVSPTWILKAIPGSNVTAIRVTGVYRGTDHTLSAVSDHWYVAGGTGGTQLAEPIDSVSDCIGATPAEISDGAIPPNLSFDDGFSGLESNDKESWEWGKAHSTLHVLKLIPVSARVRLRMTIMTLGISHITISAAKIRLSMITKAGIPSSVSIPIDLRTADDAKIQIGVTGGVFHAVGDPRELGVQVSDVSLQAACY